MAKNEGSPDLFISRLNFVSLERSRKEEFSFRNQKNGDQRDINYPFN